MRFLKTTLSLLFVSVFSLFFLQCEGEKAFPTSTIIDNIGKDNHPTLPGSPSPANGSTNNFRLPVLTWQSIDLDGDSLLYDVFFCGDSVLSFLNIIAEEYPDTFLVIDTTIAPFGLAPNTTVFWKIDVRDNKGNWIFGDVWTFTTGQFFDNPPVPVITSPANNATFTINESITFQGSATDVEDTVLTGNSLQWSSTRDGLIGTGNQFSTTQLTGGIHTISLAATDSKDGTSQASIQITVIDTTAPNLEPTASITEPGNNLSFGQGAAIVFRGTGLDPEDGALTGTSLQWISSINGNLGSGSPLTISTLSVGDHVITLRATDSQGSANEASINLRIATVSEDNEPPQAFLVEPQNGQFFALGSAVRFVGGGTDPEDKIIPGISLSWESDKDGFLGAGSPFDVSTLSKGKHVITFKVTDSGFKEDTEMITIFIGEPNNTGPVARFSITQTNLTPTATTVDITLDASNIFDEQDIIGEIEIRWDFNNDGTWDTPFEFGSVQTHSYTRGANPYFVKLGVRDPGGLEDEATLVVPEAVYVPAGIFLMGSTAGSPSDEQPQRTVTLNAYYVDRYEITNAQFAAFLSVSGNESYYSTSMSIDRLSDGTFAAKSGLENYPVAFVNWFAAESYSAWAGKRLPTEAEWEKAARGGQFLDQASTIPNSSPSRIYPWGSALTLSHTNYKISGRPFNGLAPVATYTGQFINGVQTINNASPYGANDMLGNIGEWVNDYYQADYYATAPNNNPQGPASGSLKVFRGASFDHTSSDISIPKRFFVLPSARPYNVGLRCVKNP